MTAGCDVHCQLVACVYGGGMESDGRNPTRTPRQYSNNNSLRKKLAFENDNCWLWLDADYTNTTTHMHGCTARVRLTACCVSSSHLTMHVYTALCCSMPVPVPGILFTRQQQQSERVWHILGRASEYHMNQYQYQEPFALQVVMMSAACTPALYVSPKCCRRCLEAPY